MNLIRREVTTIAWALLLAATAGFAEAGTQYFDAGGGTKNWSGNWANTPGGPYDQAWLDGSDAVFEGTGGSVGVDGSYSVNSVTFGADGYSLGTGSLILAGNGTMNGTGFIVNSGSSTVGSTISGSNNFVKLGSGAVSLTGANSYGGGTDVNEGTLSVSSISDALDRPSNIGYNYLSVNYGGTFQYTGAESVSTDRALWIDRTAGTYGGPNGAGATFDIQGGALTFTGAGGGAISQNFTKTGDGALTMGVAIGGNASVLARGGVLTLSDANTHGGGTGVEGGTVVVSSIADSGPSGLGTGYLAVVNGGTLRYTGSDAATNRDLWVDRGVGGTFDIVNAATTVTLSPTGGALSANLTKTGAGALVIRAPITSTAAVAVNEGNLTLEAANTYSGDTTVAHSGAFTLADGGAMLMDINTSGHSSQLVGSGTVTLAGDLLFDMAGVSEQGEWTIVDKSLATNYASTFSVALYGGEAFTVDASGDVWTYDTVYNATAVRLTFTESLGMLTARAVPEPSSITLVALGGIGIVAYYWRKRK
jgi:fibronectin-binding autotransporter adhesin